LYIYDAAPGADVAAAGDAILAKMMHLKSFVKNQRKQGATRWGAATRGIQLTRSVKAWL
jgi:hypothetical protein